MKITILGCGGSMGVPEIGEGIGGNWGDCDPNNPKNYRTRPSILVEKNEFKILVDTTPDLRQQLLRENISKIDAVLYTHCHADHINGIDDLRSICKNTGKPVNIYSDANNLDKLEKIFPYVFRKPNDNSVYKPNLIKNEINGPFELGGVNIIPFEQDHGFITSLGFRFDDMAYSTDVIHFSDEAFDILRGIKIWIVDCAQIKELRTHSFLEKTLKWIEIVKPERAILTHMNHFMDYDSLIKILPQGVEPAYDGLIL